ncbi:MAG: iron ABC transporter [Halobacteriovoraceae bacterium]|nr:iron ABC transporter [Halobacteriovoraceae bacterium]|tara:strand:- start:11933 stop:12457 length:525 start_codon:yes stop_codon:yes gene_type:complete
MKKDFVVAIFDDEEKLLSGAFKARDKNMEIYDVYTPFPVHGLDDAMGIKRSFLPYVTFLAGAAGLTLAVSYQVWTMAIDWPINVGGKPFISWPAFVPISFELTVLFAAHTTVAAFLVYNKLFPGKNPVIMHPEQTCNKFVVAMEKDKVSLEDAKALFSEHGALEVKIQNVDMNP